MEIRWKVLTALLYPFSIATISAGLIAFVMIVLQMDLLLIGAVTLWFYFLSAVSIYAVMKEAIKIFRVQKIFLSLIVTFGVFAVLASLLILLGFSY
ncbi:MAG: hypothetical protein ABH852_00020 [Methanobacteriota archaeon]